MKDFVCISSQLFPTSSYAFSIYCIVIPPVINKHNCTLKWIMASLTHLALQLSHTYNKINKSKITVVVLFITCFGKVEFLFLPVETFFRPKPYQLDYLLLPY